MKNRLHFILKYSINNKPSKITTKKNGFTLIELLVAMILAVLVLTPLLGFMINILDTDRKEQAKVNSEQEIQTALDYITQDLKQAIYIYDAKGIKAIRNKLPYPSDTDKVPVLVFWSRQFEKEAIGGSFTGKNDSFVYSLVIYYLIQSNSDNNPNQTWSKQFRIARFELKDGIRDPEKPNKVEAGNLVPNYIKDKEPDQGFALFKINDPTIKGTLEEKMNSWKKDSTDLTYNLNKTAVLVDFIDASPRNDLMYKELIPVDCTTVFDLDNVPSDKKVDRTAALRVPSFAGTHLYSSNQTLNNSSFYACVDIDKVSAKIFLRGNAYARINNGDTNYNTSRQSYFPTASSQVKARGLIGALKE
ncbi:hormogonium polysaccharide secretion pseudopilin HpsC [Rivularia sp. UHCC 0363]|uniref:hormogonium polysaccharide secretion pseudopilin HpsC n=1 Tax=Rivularia sp. UHCC 0363 TaxID=3110244 RepID=UPI002B21C658|nr:hormogonium polysaccharide secretion pseudopilin HpsC [Rivularia sp. UHCC 0363]MEA5598950.1 hormogonium polysaccharide secretion pseudopilin HpsC [Rivularia sp. UHCC 0363]